MLDSVNSLAPSGGAVYLSGKDASGSPSILAITPDGETAVTTPAEGMRWCELASGSDAVVLMDAQGDLFLTSIASDDPPMAIDVRAEGRLEAAGAGDILVLAAEELSYRGDTFQIVVLARSTGAVLDAAKARDGYDELSHSASQVHIAPRWPRPGDSIFRVQTAVETPTLEAVALEPGAAGSAFLGWSSELGFVWGDTDGPPSVRVDRITIGDRQMRLSTRVTLGRSYLLTGRYLLYDARDNSVLVVDLLEGRSWRVSLGPWSGRRAPSIRLAADGDHAIVCSDDKVVRISLMGDAPEVVQFD